MSSRDVLRLRLLFPLSRSRGVCPIRFACEWVEWGRQILGVPVQVRVVRAVVAHLLGVPRPCATVDRFSAAFAVVVVAV
jgi:hypothetical protein